MTDLELAAEVVDEMGQEIGADRVFWPETWRRKISAALAAARREGAEQARRRLLYDEEGAIESAYRQGAEEMRERAAKAADRASELVASTNIRFGSISEVAADLAKDLADAIRALPLTPEEPA